jgi:hypothetical protein
MIPQKLFMLLLGCTPEGRNIEQHDIYFTIASDIKDTVPGILAFWPEANGKIHIDAWREVTRVDDFSIEIISRDRLVENPGNKLFFINLGGYKEREFDEFHYKMLSVATEKSEAIKKAKQTAFYKHTRFQGAESHVDDKFGLDVDDFYEIDEILPPEIKQEYSIRLSYDTVLENDEIHLGYFKLNAL